MAWSRCSFLVLSLASLPACAGTKTPQSVTPKIEDPAASAPAPPLTEPSAPALNAPAETPPALNADTDPDEEGGEEREAGRNVKYIVSPEGMRIEVDGVTFTPKAEAVKSGAGWVIKVRVQARAKGDSAYSLLAPTGAEVAIAGVIRRGSQATPEMLSDHRNGDRELILTGKAVTLTRTWPGAGGPEVLAPGDEADLLVGIWGLGEDATSRRPVRKLCKLTVKFDKPKPRVSVGAPDGISK